MSGAIAKKSAVEGEWRPVNKNREGAWTLLFNKDPESKARTLAVPRALTDVRILVISHGPLTPGP